MPRFRLFAASSMTTFAAGTAANSSSLPTALEASWTKLSDGPWGARQGLMVASVGDQMILTGGRGTAGLGFAGGSDIWRSSDGSSWSKAPEAAWDRRSYHIVLGPDADGCIFLMGGQTFTHFYNDVWRTCDGADSWEEVVPDGQAPWKARAGLGGAMHKGRLVIAGGCYDKVDFDPGLFRSFYNDVWSSADGKTWELMTDSAGWKARSGPRLESFDGKLFIIAGEIGFTDDTQLADIWSSSDDGRSWSLVTSSPAFSARSGHGVVTYGGYMVLVAGWPDLTDIYYTQDGKDWVLASGVAWNCDDNSECGRFDFWPLIHQGKLFLIGGSGSKSTFGKLYSETWSLQLPTEISGAVVI